MEKQIITLHDEVTKLPSDYEVFEAVTLESKDVVIQIYRALELKTQKTYYMFSFINLETGYQTSARFGLESFLKLVSAINCFCAINKEPNLNNNLEILEPFLKLINTRK